MYGYFVSSFGLYHNHGMFCNELLLQYNYNISQSETLHTYKNTGGTHVKAKSQPIHKCIYFSLKHTKTNSILTIVIDVRYAT